VDDGRSIIRRKLVFPRAARRDADPDGAGAAGAGLRDGGLVHGHVGGLLGYTIGAVLYDSVGAWLIQLYGYGDKVEAFRDAYAQWGAWIILLKGLTPIPFKVVTITSGFAGYNLGLFLLFSVITRGARFFLLAFLLHRYGEQARHIIEKRLGLWVLLGAAVIVVGIVAALYLI
jgi:membrane protein YqaA with SNARE-associated domain